MIKFEKSELMVSQPLFDILELILVITSKNASNNVTRYEQLKEIISMKWKKDILEVFFHERLFMNSIDGDQ